MINTFQNRRADFYARIAISWIQGARKSPYPDTRRHCVEVGRRWWRAAIHVEHERETQLELGLRLVAIEILANE